MTHTKRVNNEQYPLLILPETIRTMRKGANLSQPALAQTMHVHRTLPQKWESGARPMLWDHYFLFLDVCEKRAQARADGKIREEKLKERIA